MHSWVFTIEATDPRLDFLPTVLRRKVEDACEHGPGGAYAWELQRAALALLPYCSALDAAQHRSPATILAACRLLHGDRLAAAQVLNRAGLFREIEGPQDGSRLPGLFAYRSSIDWNGERFAGDASGAAGFWAAHLGPGPRWPNFYFRSVEGESANRIRLIGTLSRSTERPDGRDTQETARVEQIWARRQGGEVAIESATVGPWEPYPPAPTEANR